MIRSLLWKTLLVLTILFYIGFNRQDVSDLIIPAAQAFGNALLVFLEMLKALASTISGGIGDTPPVQ